MWNHPGKVHKFSLSCKKEKRIAVASTLQKHPLYLIEQRPNKDHLDR